MEELILNNPYRVLGLYTNAKQSDIEVRSEQILKLLEKGYDTSFPSVLNGFLPKITRTKAAVLKAKSDLSKIENRIKYALYWFCKTNSDIGLLYLEKNDEMSAVNEFSFGSSVTARLNFALVMLIRNNVTGYIQTVQSIIHNDNRRIQFLNEIFAEDIIHDEVGLMRLWLDSLVLLNYNEKALLSGLSVQSDIEYIKSIMPKKELYYIETEIEKSSSIERQDIKSNIKHSEYLLDNIAPQLYEIWNRDTENATKYEYIYDRLVKAVIRHMTNVYNVNEDRCDTNNIKEYGSTINDMYDILGRINVVDVTFDTQEKYLKVFNAVKNIYINKDSYLEHKLVSDPSVCYFCGKKTAEDQYKVGVDLYKEFDRYEGVLRREVKFNHTKVFINCCENCHKIHQSGCTAALISFVVSEVIAIVLFLNITGNPVEFSTLLIGFIIGFVPSGIITFLTNYCISNSKAKRANIKDHDDVNNHPIVKEYLKKGWTREKPSPR
jgi:hypothetical protein